MHLSPPKSGLLSHKTGWSQKSGHRCKENYCCIQIVVLHARWSLNSGSLTTGVTVLGLLKSISKCGTYVELNLGTLHTSEWTYTAHQTTEKRTSTMSSMGLNTGTRSEVMLLGSRNTPASSFRLYPSACLSRSETFHNFIVLSEKKHKQWLVHHAQILIKYLNPSTKY